MGFEPFKVFSVDMTSGATKTSGIDLGGHAWERVAVEIPTMTSGGTLYVQSSSDDSTYRRISQPDGGSSVVNFQIAQTVTNTVAQLPPGPYRYMKVENTSGTTDTTVTFKFHCS